MFATQDDKGQSERLENLQARNTDTSRSYWQH